MDINIGSNTLRNTNGVVIAHGQELIRIEVGESDGQLLLTMGMYMPTGSEVAKLERNAWVSNEGDRFEITAEPHSVKVMDNILKNVVIQMATDDTKKIEDFPRQILYIQGDVVGSKCGMVEGGQ